MVKIYRVSLKIKQCLGGEQTGKTRDYTFVNKRSLIKFLESFGLVNVKATLKKEGIFSNTGLVYCFSTFSDCAEHKEGSPIAYLTVDPIRPDTILELCPTYGIDLLNSYRAE